MSQEAKMIMLNGKFISKIIICLCISINNVISLINLYIMIVNLNNLHINHISIAFIYE